ncbi:MAG: SRPBCC family protein [Tepidisphaeraceae bacterium]
MSIDPSRLDTPEGTGPAPVLTYATDERSPARRRLARWLPAKPFAAGVLAVIVPQPVGLFMTWLSVAVLREYGWALFVMLPSALGFAAAVVFSAGHRRSLGQCVGVGMLAVLAYGVALMLFAMEGAVCVVMALPLALPLAAIGGAVGSLFGGTTSRHGYGRGLLGTVIVLLPALMGAERALHQGAAPSFAVTTVVEVGAPPEVVWRHVVDFPTLPPPREFMFRAGVAYPIAATIAGAGVGAVRRCEFSTGAFVEPITTWDQPRLLKFDVTSNPPPMREWSFWNDVHPPHLDNFLISRGGEFRLTPLPGGRTRLQGTTWYQHHMWPAGYWKLWSDYFIHTIHLRVLEHVKGLAENDAFILESAAETGD